MRPAEFAPESITQAGQDLQATGRNITGFALRQKVGGGNPSRLRQVWDEHLASQSVTKVEPVAELPVDASTDPADWHALDAAYNSHHFNCPTCIAAGRGSRYGLRCGTGASLWRAYSEA